MTSETELAKEAKILDLFDSYPSASPSRENLQQYLAAVEGLSLEAVTRSVQQFRAGLVERPNRDFAPSAETFAHNAREWQRAIDVRNDTGPELHNGLVECDWGHGRVDMRGLTNAEQDQIIAAKGRAPDGRSLAYMPLVEIRAALVQRDLAQVEGGKTFQAPRLGRMS
jgi:hypothetical protein